jgi:FixJ family two-component response regulator
MDGFRGFDGVVDVLPVGVPRVRVRPDEPEPERAGTVFVVDDDPDVLQSVALLLGSVRLSARTFHAPLDFLGAVERGTPGCLVLGLRLPGMSGAQLQRRLLGSGWSVPVVFLTAHGDVPTAWKR